jgi:hypothetical protein
MHEAYQPIIEDGRGRFPEDLRVKAPRGARAAIAAAAQIRNTTRAEYVRQALFPALACRKFQVPGSWSSTPLWGPTVH